MQLQNCNASYSVKVFLRVNLTLEDETPLPFQQEKTVNTGPVGDATYLLSMDSVAQEDLPEHQRAGDNSVQGTAVSMDIFLPHLL